MSEEKSVVKEEKSVTTRKRHGIDSDVQLWNHKAHEGFLPLKYVFLISEGVNLSVLMMMIYPKDRNSNRVAGLESDWVKVTIHLPRLVAFLENELSFSDIAVVNGTNYENLYKVDSTVMAIRKYISQLIDEASSKL